MKPGKRSKWFRTIRLEGQLLRFCIEQEWRCYYCNELMLSYSEDEESFGKMATIEHVYSRMDIRRYVRGKKVAAHYKCNHAKAHQDELKINQQYGSKERYYKDIVKKLVKGDFSVLNKDKCVGFMKETA